MSRLESATNHLQIWAKGCIRKKLLTTKPITLWEPWKKEVLFYLDRRRTPINKRSCSNRSSKSLSLSNIWLSQMLIKNSLCRQNSNQQMSSSSIWKDKSKRMIRLELIGKNSSRTTKVLLTNKWNNQQERLKREEDLWWLQVCTCNRLQPQWQNKRNERLYCSPFIFFKHFNL